MNKNTAVIFPCDNIKYIPINKCNCLSQGSCLIVPVSIHSVCSNSYLLVIVEVYKEKKLYARRIKKIFTGASKENKCNCCVENDLIDCLFVDNFKFYFINDCNPKSVHVEVNTQYIYDC